MGSDVLSVPVFVVRRYHQAWTGGDVEQAMRCVADDVVCHGPGGDIVGRDAYRGFLTGFAPRLVGAPEIAEFTGQDRVALFYRPQAAATSTAVAGECFTVRDGLIVETWLVFDRLSYQG